MKKLILTLLLCVLTTIAHAQTSVTSEQATVELVTGGYNANGEIMLGLHYKLQPGWHIYWRTPGDNGFPQVLDWSESTNINPPTLLWPAPQRLIDKINDKISTESYLYKNEVLFPITLSPQDPAKPVHIKLHINYAICKDICIPAEADFASDIEPAFHDDAALGLIGQYLANVPQEDGHYGINITDVSSNGKALKIQVTSEKSLAKAEIFIEDGEDFAFYSPKIFTYAGGATFTAPISFLTNKKSLENQSLKITVKNGAESIERTINSNEISTTKEVLHEDSRYTLGLILLFGLLGGLILNVMPCVLPVLSIKLLSVIKHSGSSKSKIAASFLVTALGIISSFITLALLVIGLHAAGMNVGWGFHFQEPVFIIALVIILTFFTANLWGFFEIRMPDISDKAYKKSSENSHLGHFLAGVLATVLATPCTAPFLGTAVSFALSRGSFEILSTFSAMGIGMASPYLLFSLFPHFVTKLPRPGAWMVTVKKLMGLLLATTAAWLVWVLANQIGQVSAVILSALCFFGLIILHTKFRKSIIVAFIAILAFSLPMMFSSHPQKITNNPNSIWQAFDIQKIPDLVASGKTVFVDVTADWCLTCKVNKFTVLSDREIQEKLSNSKVVAMQADWTNKDERITEYMRMYMRAGIPFNIVYGPSAPSGIPLPELLSKQAVLDALKKAE
jgi:suppressor for copper-sensitivity B